MSQENVESLRQGLDAFNRRDREAWLAVCDPELQNFPPREWPESDPVHGREAVWDLYVEVFDMWERGPLEPIELIDTPGDTVVARVQGQMQGKASGVSVPWALWQVVTFRDRRSFRIAWFADRAEAFEAAGLGE